MKTSMMMGVRMVATITKKMDRKMERRMVRMRETRALMIMLRNQGKIKNKETTAMIDLARPPRRGPRNLFLRIGFKLI